MLRKIFITALLGVLFLPNLMASHFMGGEITWECLPNGNYRFIMRVYRECQGCNSCYQNTEHLETNAPGYPSPGITISLYPTVSAGKKDLSPTCNPNSNFPHIKCYPAPSLPNTGAVEEYTYTTDAAYPNGVDLPATAIPATGWYFAFSGSARNSCANYSSSGNQDWWLRAIMYPYPSTTADNCWDNSPEFGEKPTTVICTGYPFTYNPNGYDKELDSLSYEWAHPLVAQGVNYGPNSPNYTYNSPLPGTSQNINNVPATVDPFTGTVSFTSFTSGAFVTAYKVTAWKCGIKIAEIFREMQIVLLNCPTASPTAPPNHPPVVDPPFLNPATGLYTEYVDTVFAGSIVNFYLTATDYDSLNKDPSTGLFDMQTVSIDASGQQFGDGNFTSTTTGCLHPPCATLNPPPPASSYVFTATNFVWQTTCAHLATENPCGGFTNSYNFILKASDDFCPAKAYSWKTVTIVVKNPIMPPPKLKCASVAEDGKVTINWQLSDTNIVPNSWSAYYIYRADNSAGPFVKIDSIVLDPANNILFSNTTSYLDNTANGQNSPYFYYIKVRSGCYGDFYSQASNIIRTINPIATNIGGGVGHFTWNSISTYNIATSSHMYHLWRKDAVGSWYQVDSTLNLQLDKVIYGCGPIKFRVSIYDSTGCESMSAIDTALFGAALPATLHCLAVQPNGTVTVSYTEPVGSNAVYFSAYLIYCSNNLNGPYTLIDSIMDPGLNSWNIHQVNANSGPLYFYFITRISCGAPFWSVGSDTLRTIYLDITNLTPSTSTLDWNVIHNPPLTGSTLSYKVYRRYPGLLWSPIGTTTDLTLNDGLIQCGDSIAYRVEMADVSGCKSVSNISKAYYYDDVPPPVPLLDSVSVDSLTGNVMIGWTPNDAETVGYILFYDDNGVWPILDTIWGTTNTFYLDKKSPGSACDQVKRYAIAAIDSCDNVSQMGTDKIHNTLRLVIAYVDPCGAQVTLDWNTYENMAGLAGYNVFYSDNGGPKTLLGTVPAPGPGLPPPTTFVHSNYTENHTYCYSIQAFNTNGTVTSRSCDTCLLATKPKQPKFNYLKVATVEENRFVRLKIKVDVDAYVTEYKVMRSSDKVGPYDAVGTIPPSNIADIIYDDFDARPKQQSYYYFIEVIDSCGMAVLSSDTARTIFVTVDAKIDFTNLVKWNDYEGWNWSTVNAYNIFRGIDGMQDPIPIATLPYGKTEYSDDVTGYIETQGKFQYIIEAVERPGGSFPFVDTSYSNITKDVQRSLVFMPNAFSPKGYNNIFKPVSSFVDNTGYIFQIYNRWGEMIFETHDPTLGWDGTYKGDYVPAGVYVYYVKCKTSESQVYERRSTVTVIK
ncbi:MAG: gliding motility-associated C-terminal domain-containing protein [Bacteroidota bacterium]